MPENANQPPSDMGRVRRLSHEQAAVLATDIASTFVHSQPLKGWQCEVGPATPDHTTPECDGKTPRRWSVGVRYHREGATMDGPSVVIVNLETREANWLE